MTEEKRKTRQDALGMLALSIIVALACVTEPISGAIDWVGEVIWRDLNDCPPDVIALNGGIAYGCNMYNPYRNEPKDVLYCAVEALDEVEP
jgi:hypothetical protein